MRNIIIISVAVIFILSSCEKKLDIDIPDGQKHIVLNGIINPDCLIQVSVSKSQNILDNDDIQYLTDADVKLYKNDEFIENLIHSDSGLFKSTVFPEIGANYRINVDYDNLTSVYAHNTLKNPVDIFSVDTVIEVHTQNGGGEDPYQEYEIHYKIKIDDNGNTNDYYFLALSRISPYYEYIGEEYIFMGYVEYPEYYDTNDPVLRGSNNEFTLDGMQGKVFSDELFNGTQHTIDISTNIYYEVFKDKSEQEYLVNIKLLTVTEEIYRYITSYNLNQQSKYDPFAQPVQIYTNIENGLGLFSGYTMYVDSLVMDF